MGGSFLMGQILVPVADVLVGSWSSVPLYQKINSVEVNDSTFVVSDGNPSSDEFRVDVANPDVVPVGVVEGHILRYRIRKSGSGGRQIDFAVRLLDRSVSPSKVIATYNHVNVSNIFVQFNQELNSSQVGEIESYNHLVISYIANAVGGGAGRNAHVSWGQLEIPEAPDDVRIVNSFVDRIEGNSFVDRPTLFTNFSEYATGVIPDDWTPIWRTEDQTWAVREKGGTVGGKVLEHTAISGLRRLIRWDSAGLNIIDVEVVGRVRNQDTATFVTQNSLVVRGSGGGTVETGYQCRIQPIGAEWYLQLVSFKNGAAVLLTNPGLNITDIGYTGGNWFWIRLRVIGNVIQGKGWLDGNPEPGDFQLIFNDTTDPILSGGVGCSAFSHLAGPRDFDVFGVGYDGDTAPMTDVDVGERVVNSFVRRIEGQALAEGPVPDSLFTDFSAYSTGVQPFDWSNGWVVSGDFQWIVVEDVSVIGGKYLEQTAIDAGRRLLTWDAIGNVLDVEMVSKIRHSRPDGFDQQRLILRASGGASDFTGYWCADRGTGSFDIGRFIDGASAVLDTTPHSVPADTWFWVRFRVIGSLVSAKIWEDGMSEPVGWMVEFNDSANVIDEVGGVGFSTFQLNHERDFDVVGVAFGGDTAPMEEPGAVVRTVISYVDRIEGEVLTESIKLEELDSYVDVLDGEVERLGEGERIVESYVDVIDGESVREGVEVERIVDSYVRRIDSNSRRGRQIFTDFTEYDISLQPHDWIVRWDLSGGSDWRIIGHGSEFALEHVAEANGNRLITWDVVPVEADMEIASVSHILNLATDQVRLILRGSGDVGNESGWVLSLNNGESLLLISLENGSFNVIQNVAFSYDYSVYVQMRFRVYGDVIQGKAWLLGDVEPENWMIDIVDGRHSEAGWSGLGAFNYQTFGMHFLFAGFGTLGLEAPLEFPQDFETAVISYVDRIESESERDGVSGEREVESFVGLIDSEVESLGVGDREVVSYVDVINGDSDVDVEVVVVSSVGLINGVVVRVGDGDRLVEGFVNVVFSEADITVERVVESHVNTIFSLVEREGIGERIVESFVSDIVSEVVREGFGEKIVEVYVDRIDGESVSVLALVRDAESHVNTIFGEVVRVGSGERISGIVGRDFSEYDTGVEPFDWTRRWKSDDVTYIVEEDVLAVGGKRLRQTISPATNAWRILTWDRLDGSEDIDISVKFRNTVSTGTVTTLLGVRIGGTAGNELGYTLHHSNTGFILRKHTPSLVALDSVGFPFVANEWYWFRFRIVGNQLMAKAWQDGNVEPQNFQLNAIDNDFTSGFVGVGGFHPQAKDFDVVITAIEDEAFVDVINGEVVVEGNLSVDSFVNEVHGEVERVGVGERELNGFVGDVVGEVERVGSGERSVDGFVEQIHGESRVEVEVRVVSFVGVIDGESVRDGVLGERDVDGYVGRIEGQSISELDGQTIVVSFVERIEGESVREGSGERVVNGFSNDIHGESLVSVRVEVNGYVREIESEVVRDGSGERVVSSYFDVIMGDVFTSAVEDRIVESHVREIFGEVLRVGFGLRDVESFVDAVFGEAVIERSVVRVVDSWVNIGSESDRTAINFETVNSWVRTIFSNVFLFDPPPLLDEDIDLGLLVSDEDIDLGLLVEGDVEDGEIDLGLLVEGELIDLGLLGH